MSQKFLDVEIELLLLKHGESAVLKAMARVSSVSEDELRKKLDELRTAKKPSKAARAKLDPIQKIRDKIKGADNEDLLNQLVEKYQNKQFLPRAADAQRFLPRNHGRSSYKGRLEAAVAVFETLRTWEKSRIQDLLEDTPSSADSEFSQLSKQIIEGS